MARTGIYFSDVKKARDALVAKGRRPSIDAIRAALGDTGSKTTIHKFLRELEAGEGTPTLSVSDAILALTTQLADQLKAEADADIGTIRTQLHAERQTHAAALADLEQQLEAARAASEKLSGQLETAQEDTAALTARLHTEEIARHTAEQRTADLNVRLGDAERHQASLEDKHRSAREALEHYRTAAKEQREQDTRRHAQQVQGVQAELRQAQLTIAVKLEETTRLNKEAAALANELGANKEALFRERDTVRNMTWKVAQLPVAEARIAVLETQLKESRAHVGTLEATAGTFDATVTRMDAEVHTLRQQNAVLETELASARNTTALEARLAKLDQAVFGADKPAAAKGSPRA